ncbi:sensor histidine kinase [Emticicia sp. TH156]|uniref:sensor histidine kinase n=1 Tax=Emticicia sp. TH156 TaxID=2067454 RepID=UPI0013043B60|nr:histidine kinase [Emticicia sp. TH156]
MKNVFIIAHWVGWLLVFSLTALFLSENRSLTGVLLDPNLWTFFLIYIFIFYVNLIWLIPSFFFKRKFMQYFVFVLITFVLIVFVKPFDRLVIERNRYEMRPRHRFEPHLPPPVDFKGNPPGFKPERHEQEREARNFDVVSVFLFGLVWALGIALKMNERWRDSEKRVLQAETDRANAELSFLKAQINPHFLFNTLNNIYTLAVTNSKKTAASIMKLSQIMRYVTDEVSEDFVPLANEIECISNYIDLQKLRLSAKTEVIFEVNTLDTSQKIPPLLLMTYVENAFKHGISNHDKALIEISIKSGKDSLHFICRNKLFSTFRKVERTGIGLSNTRQRLQHLYQDRFNLIINDDSGVYQVELTINN